VCLDNDEKDVRVSFPKFVFILAFGFSLLLTSTHTAVAAGVEISFYRATLQRDGERLVVKEAYSFSNSSDRELTPPGGELRFELPYEIEGQVTAVVSSEGGRRQMAVPPSGQDPSVRVLPTNLAPGRTSVTLSYTAKYPGKLEFSPSFAYPVSSLSVFVQPMDMLVEGDGAKRESGSVMAGFTTYTLPPLSQSGQVHLSVSGGSATPPATAAAPPAVTPPTEEEKWKVMIKPNRFGEAQTRIVIFLAFGAILGLGLLYALSSESGREEEQSAKSKRQGELLRLEDRFVSGNISREAFLEQRERLMQRRSHKTKGSKGRKPVGKA
jgi:hypothetical protein